MLTRIDKFIIFFIILAALASLPLALKASSSSRGSTLLIYKNGEKQASYNLSEKREVKVLGSDGGYCFLRIKDGNAYVVKSTCPNKICQKQGRISQAGQVIICAPMRLMFQVQSEQKNVLDAVNE